MMKPNDQALIKTLIKVDDDKKEKEGKIIIIMAIFSNIGKIIYFKRF